MTQLTVTQTNKIVDSALEHAKNMGYKPKAVVVLDDASMCRLDAVTGDEDEAICAHGVMAADLKTS